MVFGEITKIPLLDPSPKTESNPVEAIACFATCTLINGSIMSASLSRPDSTGTTKALAPTPALLDPTSRTELPVRSPLSILRHA